MTTIDNVSPAGNAQKLPLQLLRVFLVEDCPEVRAVVSENLREIAGVALAGFAETEDGALSWLRNHECDVLILDLELKQGTGIGVLKQLATEAQLPGVMKIIYSNFVGENIRRLAARCGASYFFDKTLDTPQLRRLLEVVSASQV
ncbi:MAG: response regulator [Betaproteobacteria bacterium]|nr:response regulator [Betaproteobacteria bacterium]